MLKLAALALAGLMMAATAPQLTHLSPAHLSPAHLFLAHELPASAPADPAAGAESLAVYYTPLDATGVARFVGLGTAHHMAIVYTDASGRSFGASSGPSVLAAAQTPAEILSALFAAADGAPSSFGTLVADPQNDMPFARGGAGDHYTHDSRGRAYPFVVVARGRDLSAEWAAILAAYARVGALRLPYSPISQNSNSLAVAALRRAGIEPRFSSATPFAPGSFTRLPDA